MLDHLSAVILLSVAFIDSPKLWPGFSVAATSSKLEKKHQISKKVHIELGFIRRRVKRLVTLKTWVQGRAYKLKCQCPSSPYGETQSIHATLYMMRKYVSGVQVLSCFER